MKTKQLKQPRWVDANEVNLDEVSRFSALDLLSSIAFMGLAFGLLAPFFI